MQENKKEIKNSKVWGVSKWKVGVTIYWEREHWKWRAYFVEDLKLVLDMLTSRYILYVEVEMTCR